MLTKFKVGATNSDLALKGSEEFMRQSKLLNLDTEDGLTQQNFNFEYNLLDEEKRIVIQKCTNEIKTIMRRTSQDIADIGKKLIEVKQYLGHGHFINWLKSEFNWSVSTATKFMQVAEQFKFVNFTNLNITASALYLIAAPSTPKEVRAKVLESASFGENISYSQVKEIISQYKNTANSQIGKMVKANASAKITNGNSSISIELMEYKISSSLPVKDELNEKQAQTQTNSVFTQSLLGDVISGKEQTEIDSKGICYDNEKILNNEISTVTIWNTTSNIMLNKIALSIEKLTPEQLALVITQSAELGLSNIHLETVITTSIKILKTRQL